jgi:hypothetical protein
MVVPVLIAYDSDHAAQFDDEMSYNSALLDEISIFQDKFAKKFPSNLSIYCFYFPMDSKKKLVSAFDTRLGAFF